ncbi:MAG: hypothetical protein OHK0045_22740 [Raineya sp.]
MQYSDKSLSLSFPVATGKSFPIGASVALTATGVVDTPSSHEVSIGVVTAIDTDRNRVTIATHLLNVVKGRAKTNINAGVLVKEVFADTATNGVPTFTNAAANDYAVGVALGTATANAEIEIGIFLGKVVKS